MSSRKSNYRPEAVIDLPHNCYSSTIVVSRGDAEVRLSLLTGRKILGVDPFSTSVYTNKNLSPMFCPCRSGDVQGFFYMINKHDESRFDCRQSGTYHPPTKPWTRSATRFLSPLPSSLQRFTARNYNLLRTARPIHHRTRFGFMEWATRALVCHPPRNRVPGFLEGVFLHAH